MKLTTEQHLDLIVAHCEKLLAIAEKRTAGEWTIGDENNQHIEICIGDAVANLDRQDRYGLHMVFSRDEMRANGNFIASCANNAEAGWRSTIAAVKLFRKIDNQKAWESHWMNLTLDEMKQQIIAAWPIELLRK